VDEAFSLFDDGWGVKKSIQMRKEKKEARKRFNENGSGAVGYETKAQTAHVEAV
jgi:SP family myo-inositol transporter-like MFS transporter 13